MYNNIKLGGNDIAESAVPMGATEDFVLISDAYIKKLRVDNLRAELENRVLRRCGLRIYLVKRLQQAIIYKVPIKNDQATEVENINLFSSGNYWKVLDPEDIDIDDPTTITKFHAPTVGNDEVKVA